MISGAYERINLPPKETIVVHKVNRVEEAVGKLFRSTE
jgi:hypothetical protein